MERVKQEGLKELKESQASKRCVEDADCVDDDASAVQIVSSKPARKRTRRAEKPGRAEIVTSQDPDLSQANQVTDPSCETPVVSVATLLY